MKPATILLAILTLIFTAQSSGDDLFREGATLQLLTNLHPNPAKNTLSTMNYQMQGLLKVCSKVKVTKKNSKKLEFVHDNTEYVMEYDKYTKKAGVTFDEILHSFFGEECDDTKIVTLTEKDQRGLRRGEPTVGMTKDGVLLTMGRPPYHVTPSLESNQWMYWRTNSRRTSVQFNRDGYVVRIR